MFCVNLAVSVNAPVTGVSKLYSVSPLYQPTNVYPTFTGSSVGFVAFSPCNTSWASTPLSNVTVYLFWVNLAVKVKLPVTAKEKSYKVSPLYQPMKVYPSFVGFNSGSITLALATINWSSITSSVPVTNLTV